jgi:hypothetical protein
MSITYCECVFVVLGIQHAVRLSRVTLSSVACRAQQYFSALVHKRQNFTKKKCPGHKMCFDFFNSL